jgi:hypothetical protein
MVASSAEVSAGATNSVVISNMTTSIISIYRNGRPWEDPTRSPQVREFHFPARVVPGGMVTLTNVTSTGHEVIVVQFQVIKLSRSGCLVDSFVSMIGSQTIIMGTNSPQKVIVVKRKDLSTIRSR